MDRPSHLDRFHDTDRLETDGHYVGNAFLRSYSDRCAIGEPGYRQPRKGAGSHKTVHLVTGPRNNP